MLSPSMVGSFSSCSSAPRRDYRRPSGAGEQQSRTRRRRRRERRPDESADASLVEPAVNHMAEWAGPNCKGIMEAELSTLIPGLSAEECAMEK